MLEKLQTEKKLIDAWLLNFLQEEEKNFNQQTLVKEAFTIIKDFVISGKTLRGGLFLLTTKVLNAQNYQKNQKDLLKIAAALELIHSSLLIHDDIIDQDETRRGQDSVWQNYTKFAIKNNYKNTTNYGQSLAICLGNVLNYLANLALSELNTLSLPTTKQIQKTVNQEIIKTNFAEMLDSQITLQNDLPTKKQVLEMYLYKTARYTFSLPLQLAGTINQLSDNQIGNLVSIGENLGLIFQIKDDEISLFNTVEESGKSFASDIKEGKKTLFYLYLLENAKPEEQVFLANNLGNRAIKPDAIQKIQSLFRQYSQEKITSKIKELEKNAQIEIQKISSEALKKLLSELLAFNLQRKT